MQLRTANTASDLKRNSRGAIAFTALLAAGSIMAPAVSASAAPIAAAAGSASRVTSIAGHVKGAPAGTSVSLTAADNQSGTGALVRAGGAFIIKGLSAGHYHLSVNLPTGYVVTKASPGTGADGGTKIDGIVKHHEIRNIKVVKGDRGTGYNFTIKHGS